MQADLEHILIPNVQDRDSYLTCVRQFLGARLAQKIASLHSSSVVQGTEWSWQQRHQSQLENVYQEHDWLWSQAQEIAQRSFADH